MPCSRNTNLITQSLVFMLMRGLRKCIARFWSTISASFQIEQGVFMNPARQSLKKLILISRMSQSPVQRPVATAWLRVRFKLLSSANQPIICEVCLLTFPPTVKSGT